MNEETLEEMIERAHQERAKNPNPCPGCPQNCPGYTCLRTRFEPIWMKLDNTSTYS